MKVKIMRKCKYIVIVHLQCIHGRICVRGYNLELNLKKRAIQRSRSKFRASEIAHFNII